ncbi:MAG: hypothetical protein KDC34_18010 [Saprospiraceae bacterium]|nr:hypothetical protein [Saprospiraceae bacterium]
MQQTGKYALVTVTTESFIPGSLVMVHSFLKHNPWFEGDIIVLADNMEPRFQRFFHLFPNIHIEQISQEVIERTDKVSARFTQFARRRAQFYSLDLARFTNYDKLIFLDSDILVLDNLQDALSENAPLLACGDGFYYNDKLRDAKTFEYVKKEDIKPGQETWPDTFNAGFMVFDGQLLRGNHHDALVKMIDHDLFGSVTTNHSDQLIFNKYFRNNFKLLSGAYNFRLGVSEMIKEKDGITYEDAKLIHFVSKRKPWDNVQVLLTIPKFSVYGPAYHKWQECWLDFLDGMDNLPTVEQISHG